MNTDELVNKKVEEFGKTVISKEMNKMADSLIVVRQELQKDGDEVGLKIMRETVVMLEEIATHIEKKYILQGS